MAMHTNSMHAYRRVPCFVQGDPIQYQNREFLVLEGPLRSRNSIVFDCENFLKMINTYTIIES